LNQANGQHDLLDIAERSGLQFEIIASVAAELAAADVIRKI